ncbi:hypothetical protein [Mameliella alba]|uniref:hypothetical protein n=1 Tax=Mameliella alba TaxID=561184 RepID=UPI001054D1CD|nr:hypothetical protein [Mameliella alba]
MKYCAIALLLTGALALSACKEEGVTLSFVSSERVQAKDIFGFETREKRCKAIFEIKNEFSKPIDEITVRMDFFNAAGEAEVRSSVSQERKHNIHWRIRCFGETGAGPCAIWSLALVSLKQASNFHQEPVVTTFASDSLRSPASKVKKIVLQVL